MKKNKLNILIVIIFSIFLTSCQTAKEVFGGKKRSEQGDEFLVEKKNPLALPPDYDKLPLPGSKTSNREENLNIENIISGDSNSEGNTSNKSSVERSIEEELRKKNWSDFN